MADYPDLGYESPAVSGQDVRAIGWLEPDHPFPTGPVPKAFHAKLVRDLARATPTLARVVYGCRLCDDADFEKRELFIPAGPLLYVAPPQIVHSIDVHGYRPPGEFVEALLVSPSVGSLRYRVTLLRHARHLELWPTIVTLPLVAVSMIAVAPIFLLFRWLGSIGRRRSDDPFA